VSPPTTQRSLILAPNNLQIMAVTAGCYGEMPDFRPGNV
jgi:hypothetical protein